MKVVIDTNIIVTALLSPYSYSSKVLRLVLTKKIDIALDSRIISEYREVLMRPKFDFELDNVKTIMDYLYDIAEKVIAVPVSNSLPDPDDKMFYEVTISSNAEYLITGNKKHF
ncbi:MAG: putative toxin-antitoxin system toxin component, PIN family, partial [Candidatus Cloacimonetes bacterium]|nr:putative toxin-antitoxin system toxin component, PIN family [Candidatus Cloacimonadota bacterium]